MENIENEPRSLSFISATHQRSVASYRPLFQRDETIAYKTIGCNHAQSMLFALN